MMIALVIVAVLVVTGGPAFSAWITNNQIRASANAMLLGLQLARGEAIRRNTTVMFTLTTTVDNNCNRTISSGNWVVSLFTPEGFCANTPGTVPAQIIQIRPSSETSRAVITSDQSQITFNGFGRANLPLNLCVGIAADSGGCIGTESEHRLKVQVTAAGQVKMCNPALDSTDPQGC
jgi:type IV fimbrial biogenesis protein FimT